ncbi:MAG: hypothetical protein NTV94_04075, partial [Planctomycetota bacterium]|nr:hypothetical protein [Planctomycetota bacterium]
MNSAHDDRVEVAPSPVTSRRGLARFAEIGWVVGLAAAGVVFLLTIRTHRGSPLLRIQNRRRWKERQKTGTVTFRPVTSRPD